MAIFLKKWEFEVFSEWFAEAHYVNYIIFKAVLHNWLLLSPFYNLEYVLLIWY